MNKPIKSIVFHDSNCYEADEFDSLEDVEEFEIDELDEGDGNFHLLIGRNGRIMRGLSDGEHSNQVHIFVMGDFDQKSPTDRQIKTIDRLFDWFEFKFNWRVEPAKCLPHRDVSTSVDECPGSHFPIETFRDRCAERIENPDDTPFHDYEEHQERRQSLNECNREIKRINGDMSKNIQRFESLTSDIEGIVEDNAA